MQAAPTAAKKEKMKVLDPKRSNAVGILISRLPEPKVIKSAIRDLDELVLEREQVDQIRMVLPSADEEEELNARDGADVVWDRPEAFLRMLLSVPRVGLRLRCWSIASAFEERAAELEAPIEALKHAFEELMGSEPLRVLLGLLLSYGNYMNGGTNRGQADGFPITDLMSVCGVKASQGRQTLLGYALKELTDVAAAAEAEGASADSLGPEGRLLPMSGQALSLDRFAEGRLAERNRQQRREQAKTALLLEQSVPHIKDGCRANLGEITAQHAALVTDIVEVARAAAAEPESPAHVKPDPFKPRMLQFSAAAQARVDQITVALRAAEANLARARTFFGVTPSALKDDEILPFFLSFVGEVKRSMPPPQKPKRAPRLPKLPPPDGSSLKPSTESSGTDTMQSLIASIHAGRSRKASLAAADRGSEGTAMTASGKHPGGLPAGGGRGGADGGGANGTDGVHAVGSLPALLKPVSVKTTTPSSKDEAIGVATQLDPSLFGRSNATSDRPTAQTARTAIMARLKEQEGAANRANARSDVARVKVGGGGTGGSATPTASKWLSSETKAAGIAIGFTLGGKKKLSHARSPAASAFGPPTAPDPSSGATAAGAAAEVGSIVSTRL